MEYLANEQFAMASTFKFLFVAAVLHQIDLGDAKLRAGLIPCGKLGIKQALVQMAQVMMLRLFGHKIISYFW